MVGCVLTMRREPLARSRGLFAPIGRRARLDAGSSATRGDHEVKKPPDSFRTNPGAFFSSLASPCGALSPSCTTMRRDAG